MNNFYTVFVIYSTLFVSFEPILARELQREKRDVGTVISIIAELGPPIYQIIREFLKKKKCGKKIDAGMVNEYYNSNMDNSQQLKDLVSARMSEAGNAIHMKSSGYFCDDSYCNEMGANMKGTLGICSKEYCVCNNGIATMEKCGWFKVFDAMTGQCRTKGNAILCN